MPLGFVVVPGWYLTPAASFTLPMLPGGMIADAGVYFMIVAGWAAFTGNPPL